MRKFDGLVTMARTRSLFLTTLVSTAVLLLAGCKLEIRVPYGGQVVSTDGAYLCRSGQTCVIDVVDLFFDQTFVAEPDEGFSFLRWEDRDRHQCAGETTPCSLSTAEFEGHEMLQAILESDETFILQPRFALKAGYCPEPELVVSPVPSGH